MTADNYNKYFDFPLKKQQEVAFKSLCQFIYSDDRVFILKGYAGTGKTTLMGGLIKWLDEEKRFFSLLASTGRASKILSEKTKTTSSTIHSHIYAFSDLDDDLEKISGLVDDFKVDDKGQISLIFTIKHADSDESKVYIVDESSMVSDTSEGSSSFARYGSGKLLSDLFDYDKNGKFIFVGDPAQLPPVGQDISPSLSAEYIEKVFKIKPKTYELTDIIRQDKNNGIIQSSMVLRKYHQTNPYAEWAKMPFRNYPNISLYTTHVSLIDNYISTLRAKGVEYATLICQTNRHCSDINKIIRASFGRNPQELQKNDLLLVTQNNYLVPLVNGDIVTVLETGNREYRCGLTFLNVKVRELTSRKEHNLLLVEDILYSITTNLNAKQHKDLMVDYYRRMSARGVHYKSPAFRDNMMNDPYLNALKSVFGYAITCHKSQGGEWDEVFLYLDNKIHGIPKPGIYQWTYTAVTRARKELHVVNDWFIE